MSSRLSITKLKKEQSKWNKQNHALTSKIENKTNEQNSLKKSIDKLDATLNNSDYSNAQSSYNDLQTQVGKMKTKISNSKSTKTKSNLQKQLNDLVNKKATYASKMRSIANKNGFTDKYNQRTRMSKNVDNLNKLLKSLRTQQSKAQNKANNYQSLINNKEATKKRKRNTPIIAKKVRQNNTNTTIYRTDMQSDVVFSLVETSPSETDSNDVATKPIDGSSVQTNWISQNNREYTGTFYLKGDSFEDCDSKFRKLMDWSYKYEFTINGFSNWSHGYITSIAKSTDETISANGMIITLTFTYARQAEIKYKRETKGKTKHKASTKVQTGSHNGKSNSYVRMKPGMTLAQVAKKTGIPLATLIKNNPGKLATNAKVRLA